jgi:hypothetical protein
MSDKSLLKRLGFLVGLIIVAVLARTILTDGAPTIKLSPASSLAGAVSIGIGQASTSPLPIAGKNYQIKSTKYFDNNQWVAINILPLKTKADPATLVLKKIDGVYLTVLGPAGQFNSSYVYSLPADVSQYLSQQGSLQ